MQQVRSLVVACKLLVVVCRIYLPDQGSNPGPLHWEHEVLATGPPGKSPLQLLKITNSTITQYTNGQLPFEKDIPGNKNTNKIEFCCPQLFRIVHKYKVYLILHPPFSDG